MCETLNLNEIKQAASRIEKYIFKTPYEYSTHYSKLIQTNVYLKHEGVQRTGSFKIRGALNALIKAKTHEKKQRTLKIITASAGNHAQGIGFASKMLNKQKDTIVFIPKNTPQIKIDAIRSYGVDLRIEGEIYDEAEKAAKLYAEEIKGEYISPYNHPDVIAGQGTIGLEILNDSGNEIPDAILVPVSGGGLLSGILIAVKSINPNIKVYGIQSEACPAMYQSVIEKKIVAVPMRHSIAEGLHGGIEENSITFQPILKYCDGILLVSEEEIKIAIYEYLKYHNKICEGAGAVGIAALKRYSEKFKQFKNIAVVISGSNIDFPLLKEIINQNAICN